MGIYWNLLFQIKSHPPPKIIELNCVSNIGHGHKNIKKAIHNTTIIVQIYFNLILVQKFVALSCARETTDSWNCVKWFTHPFSFERPLILLGSYCGSRLRITPYLRTWQVDGLHPVYSFFSGMFEELKLQQPLPASYYKIELSESLWFHDHILFSLLDL